MTRYRASLTHLAISAVIVGAVLAIVFLIWYPGATFEIAGAVNPVYVLVSVDLVLGPLLTLIVYKQGKPGLKFDLSCSAAVQLAALIYGSYTLHAERPHYLVFAIDRVTLVASKTVDESLIRDQSISTKPLREIVRVFARAPGDPEEFQDFMSSVLFDGMPDLERRTEFWENWESGFDEISAAIQPLETFTPANGQEEQRVAAAIDQYGDEHPNLGILPVGGIEEDIGMLFDRDSLTPLGVIKVDPWQHVLDAPIEEIR